MSDAPKAYGEGRSRSGVSYAEVERAAIAILKAERRPTVETIREALGTGSPDTIANALKRFWRDLGARIEGDPAALTRMPPDIADLAEGMWQQALKLAGEAAQQSDNAALERLRHIEMENEIRAHSLELREREWDAAARSRERALADARDHLLLLSKTLGRDQATLQARDARIADLETQLTQFREQIAALIAAVHRPARRRSTGASPGKGRPRKAKRTAPAKGRAPSRQRKSSPQPARRKRR